MRLVQLSGAMILFLMASPIVEAQVGRDIRFVNVQQAEVRSGPSDSGEFYVTNRLTRGQPVEVLAELPGGWLAIRPPEGSFSYINTRFLRHMYSEMPTHVVTLDGVKVPVYMGSEVVNKRPTVVGAWLEPGAQVSSRGKPITDEDGTWMPIEAPARERRFLKASLVDKSATGADVVRTSASTTPPASSTFTPTGSSVSSSAAPSANMPQSPERLWQQAQHAERSGQMAEAIRLYALVGAETAQTQPALSSMALQRARYLQGGYQNYGAGVGPAAPPAYAGVPAKNLAQTTGNIQVGAPVASRGTWSQGMSVQARREGPGNPGASVTGNGSASWVGYRGVLRRAGRAVEGQTTYALDDPVTLRPILYATAARGVNMETYLNKQVQLWGYSFWRGDLRNNFMTAVRLVPE